MRKSLFTVLEPTSPVYDLTTVDAVNAALGITGNTASDAQLAIQITQASRMIGELCDRVFALLTVTEDFRMRWGDPTSALNLRQYPVTELTSVMQSGIEVDPQSYELDYESGLLWRKQGHWCGEIIVDYSGGYDLPDGAPAMLAQACIETLRVQKFTATHDPTIRSTTHGDTTVTFSDYYSRFRVSGDVSAIGGAVLPPNASDMIQQFKRLGV